MEVLGPLQGLQQGIRRAEHARHPRLGRGFVPTQEAEGRFLQQLTIGEDGLAIALLLQELVGHSPLSIQALHLPIRQVVCDDQRQKKQQRQDTQDRLFHSKPIVQESP